MRKPTKHTYLFLVSLIVFSLLVASCGGSSGSTPTPGTGGDTSASGSDTSSSAAPGDGIAFIYKEKIADYNWSHLQELGRQYLIAQLPDVKTSYVEDIAPEAVEATLRDLAKTNKLIFATAPEYSDAVLKVAKDFPNVKFEVARGTETADNVATYDGRMYQMFYVAGGYTGELTVSGIVGVVAPEPSVEVIRDINALALTTLLVRSHEKVSVHVKFTNSSWSDPEAERQAALDLIADGADVLVQHTYDPEVQKVAEEKGVASFGYGYDMRESAPTHNKTSIVWNWGWYFVQRVNALNDGKWTGEAYDGEASEKNFGTGIIDLAPYTYDQIPQIIEAPPMKWRARFVETSKDVFDGPLTDQNGVQVLARGQKFDESYLNTGMNWFVEGVVGDAPGTPPTPESK